MDNGITGPMYIKSHSGIFKIIAFICSLAAFVSMMIFNDQWVGDAIIFFNISSLFGMIYALLMIITNVANIGSNIGSPKIDTVICIIFSIFAFISASILSSLFKFAVIDSFRAAIVLQFFAGFAFFGNAVTKIM